MFEWKPLVAPTPRVRANTSVLYFWVYILMGLIIGSLGPSIEEVGTQLLCCFAALLCYVGRLVVAVLAAVPPACAVCAEDCGRLCVASSCVFSLPLV